MSNTFEGLSAADKKVFEEAMITRVIFSKMVKSQLEGTEKLKAALGAGEASQKL